MHILFIDDDSAAIYPAQALLEEKGYICAHTDFSSSDKAIIKYRPDLVVLDLMKGTVSDDPDGNAGKAAYRDIWTLRFCPVVVYTSNPDLIAGDTFEEGGHPLARKVTKGKGSENSVLASVQELEVCVSGVAAIRQDVDSAISHSLRDLARLLYDSTEKKLKEPAFQHMGRRRVAACLDDRSLFGETLLPWGQYIYPPLSTSPKQCDILQVSGSDPKDPASYRLLLTPSCDLVKTEKREPKVSRVLCAKCCQADGFLTKAKVSSAPAPNKVEEHKKRLGTILNTGFLEEYIPLPSFFEVIPPMAANLKQLELIEYGVISNVGEGGGYIRIASVDSPFREQMSWAYQNSGCRPGVPDRDLDVWIADYIGGSE